MVAYIIRRILFAIITLIVISIISFIIIQLPPGD
ncbi:MAG: ABC transporter permease, partial [Candidatus Heimdallarchaeaceae archaeon]